MVARIIRLIAFFVYIFCATFVCIIFTMLSVLPIKYLAILIAVSLGLAAIFGLFTFKKEFKNSQKLTKTLKIINIVFEIIFSAVFIIVFIYLNHTMNFMDSIIARCLFSYQSPFASE